MRKIYDIIVIIAMLLTVAIVSNNYPSTSKLLLGRWYSGNGGEYSFYEVIGIRDSQENIIDIPDKIYDPSYDAELPIDYIKEQAFMGNQNITTVYIHRNADSRTFVIKSEAFRDCIFLNNLCVVDPVDVYGIAIEDYAFSGCVSLSSTQWNSIQSIGDYAFAGCTAIPGISIGGERKTEKIGEMAFYNCTALRGVDLNNVGTISRYAFSNCTSLESVSLIDVDIVESYAFNNCSSLKTVSLSKDIQIASNAFEGCAMIETIYYDGTLEEWQSQGYDLGIPYDYNITTKEFVDGQWVYCTYGSAYAENEGNDDDIFVGGFVIAPDDTEFFPDYSDSDLGLLIP